ncbi:NAD-dependent epimerase/dehydratase family protein [Stieleria sp. JC731]|uniref:NAD-dependent epimerase/dehydratase family protein n=1 Tax=Pirellulaceae TaxID=2691357 RepID=UPI001E5073D4|nr:NAD-dependent epimerase/dehydratase family protein [Stieleria sp. JC731]MCC9601240.1 NAD-dependent epimerase/dehydratase family protein [Stieleria sp. JC731]
MTKTILITGICGFVGSQIATAFRQHYSANEFSIRGVDNLSRRGSWLNCERLAELDIDVQHADIRCQSDVAAIGQVDWIIDAAANPSVVAGIGTEHGSRQLLESNLTGTVNLLEHCKRHRAGFIHLSTSRVYSIPALADLSVEVESDAFRPTNDSCPAGVTENGISEQYSTAAPISLYGATKLASEQLALEYGYAFGFPVWINRCGVMAGAGQFGKADQGIFAFWLHSWKENQPLRYIGFDGRGHQVRDCLHPRDLSRLLFKQIKTLPNKQPRIINVSGGVQSARSLRQLSHWCEDRWGVHLVAVDPVPRQFDLPWMVLDHSLASTTWDWQPEITADQILDEIGDFAETQSDWIKTSR